ncbi:hypothetical protein CYMTET_3039 [Cymbomonas tetramitiformis]|uniref:RRM domain-containing protein n=1 Tax=Cymbomonas tetramitiformis TaxID=36881 RepID=A0AAE0H3W4_9CHLO|nr:hypothetical protein CYMTET_3039 [Cymbomonas tetramitiformis]
MKVSVAAPTLDPQPMPSLFPQAAPGMPQQQQESVSLDDDGEGLKLDARSRASLMARLAGGEVSIPPPPGGMPGQPAPGMGGLQQVPGPPGMPGMVPGMAGGLQTGLPPPPGSTEQGILGAPSPIPTQALLLKNLFDPEKETEDGWWLDIQEDVKEECGKYGPVQHCFVDKDSKGFVYLKFAGVESAMAAQRALHSRWFAGRMITVDYQFLAVYENRFPDSKLTGNEVARLNGETFAPQHENLCEGVLLQETQAAVGEQSPAKKRSDAAPHSKHRVQRIAGLSRLKELRKERSCSTSWSHAFLPILNMWS